MLVKAIRSDSWLGIKRGEIYKAKILKVGDREKIMVSTDGYEVSYHENDFEVVLNR